MEVSKYILNGLKSGGWNGQGAYRLRTVNKTHISDVHRIIENLKASTNNILRLITGRLVPNCQLVPSMQHTIKVTAYP